tara:strand:+ start:897 stop:1094 length:198 start_codon:yes stop_codon:yes gene_type:complete
MAVCVLIKGKSFMIESKKGRELVPEVKKITTENGWPLEGKEMALGFLLPLLLEHEKQHRKEVSTD